MAESILPLGCMYKLTFPNGKAYIGITKNTASHRFSQHVKFAREGKRMCAVHHAIIKYGSDIVNVDILAMAEWSYLTELEVRAIAAFNTRYPNGYNLTDGGEGTSGVVRSAETRLKMGVANIGRKPSDENIAKLKIINSNRVRGPDERAKLSVAHKGKKKSPDHVEKMRSAGTGKTLSAEARAKVSEFNKGKIFSDDTRAKISAAKKGVPRSPEVVARIVASRKANKLAKKSTE